MNVDPFKGLLIHHEHQVFYTLCYGWFKADPQVTENCIHSVTTRLMKRYPNSSYISKAEGMLRFYVLGKIPLAEQKWPECVIKHKPVPLGLEPSQLQQDPGSVLTAEL